MTRSLDVDEVLRLHALGIFRSGGSFGLREAGLLESAVAQPQMSFDGHDLYTGLVEKAAAIGFSLTANHAFVDGNKRVGHAAMETFLVLNGKKSWHRLMNRKLSSHLSQRERWTAKHSRAGWRQKSVGLRTDRPARTFA